MLVLGGPVGLIEQEFGGRSSELVLRLPDRGERHRRVGGELDVVVADDRKVPGHHDARLTEPAQQAQGQHVVGAEDRGGPWSAAEQVVGGGGAGARVHGRHRHLAQNRDRVQPGLRHGAVGTATAVGALPDRDRAVDQGDALVPEIEQVLDRDLAAALVIDRNRALPRRTRPVEQHDRRAAVAYPPQLGCPAVDRRDQDAANPLFLKDAQVPAFLVVRLVGVAQDHGVPRGLGVVFDAPGYLGKERVGHVKHDQAKAPAAARPELTGRAVRDEPELLHRGLDASAGQRPHQVGMVQHVRDRADRHPGQARHVLHPRRHQPSGLLALASWLKMPSTSHRRRASRR